MNDQMMMLLIAIMVILLYLFAISSAITDRYLSKREKGWWIAAIVIGTLLRMGIFIIALFGIYSSRKMKKTSGLILLGKILHRTLRLIFGYE